MQRTLQGGNGRGYLLVTCTRVNLHVEHRLQLTATLHNGRTRHSRFALAHTRTATHMMITRTITNGPLISISHVFKTKLHRSARSFARSFSLLIFTHPNAHFQHNNTLQFGQGVRINHTRRIIRSLRRQRNFTRAAMYNHLVRRFLSNSKQRSNFMNRQRRRFRDVRTLTSSRRNGGNRETNFIVRVEVVYSQFIRRFIVDRVQRRFGRFQVNLQRYPIVIPRQVRPFIRLFGRSLLPFI